MATFLFAVLILSVSVMTRGEYGFSNFELTQVVLSKPLDVSLVTDYFAICLDGNKCVILTVEY